MDEVEVEVGAPRVEDSLLHSSNRPIHSAFVSLPKSHPLIQLEDSAYEDLEGCI